jgi:Secretion system C-terminal sorting domain
MCLKKIPLFIAAILIVTQLTWSQGSIYIAPANNIFISSGTLFSADSLALLPSLNFNITGENAVSRNATVTHATANPYIKRVFHFLNTTPTFSGAISIYYTDAELNGIAENVLTLNVHNGTAWNAFAANVTRDGVNNFVTTSNLSNLALNELTLAGLSSPLPVQFTFVNAVCTNNAVTINWQTATEVNSRVFEIQTSTNGNNWQVAGTVPAAGNSTTLRNYSFIITNAIANSQYRIVEYDLDGRFIISATLRPNCTASELFTVHPNPVLGAAAVTINLNTATTMSLKLYDAKGALVKTMQRNLLRGINRVELDMKGLAAGLYILTAHWGTTLKQVSIIKQ